MTNKTADFIVSILVILIGVWFLYDTFNIPKTIGSQSLVGPKTLPLTVSVFLTLSGCLLLIKNLIARQTIFIHFLSFKKILVFACALTLYIMCLSFFNFYLTTVTAFPIFLIIAGVRSVKMIALVTILFLAFAYLGFDLLLDVPLS